MLHFFPRFSKNASDSPFGDAIRKIGVPHQIFGTFVPQTYKYRLQLLLFGYPKLAYSALLVASKSMFGWRFLKEMSPPTVSIISSDVEVLIFALIRALPYASRPLFVLIPFIFTQRKSALVNRARLLYYKFVLSRVAITVCHSESEVEHYQKLFAGCGTKFVFVPWGSYVPSPEEILANTLPLSTRNLVPRIVSAGRSGRDYPILISAVVDIICKVTIICNEKSALGTVMSSDQIDVLTDSFGSQYLAHLLMADLVVVPLQVKDISAGQMVLIQAMALARPLIVTDTPTVRDYLTNNETAILVPRGDSVALAAAIKKLLDDPAGAEEMGQRARARYLSHFSLDQHLQALVHTVNDCMNALR